MNMTEQLKPCPFCGGEPELEGRSEVYYDNKRYICSQCHAGSWYSKKESEARKYWNNAWNEDEADWKPVKSIFGFNLFKCSRCGHEIRLAESKDNPLTEQYSFCPYCGVHMKYNGEYIYVDARSSLGFEREFDVKKGE